MKVRLDPNTVDVIQNVQQLAASLTAVSQRLNADPKTVSEVDFRKSFGLARSMAHSILSQTNFMVEQVTPGDFEYFQKLPIELRLKIVCQVFQFAMLLWCFWQSYILHD